MMKSFCVACLILLACLHAAAATEAGWALVRDGGQVVLIRHARAGGEADPADFDISNCRKQRNLSDQGRVQARRMGALFAARAAEPARVLASRTCRSTETARLVFEYSEVEPFPALDPFHGDAAASRKQTAETMNAIRDFSGSGNLIMVTDEENIRALTGTGAREGEALIVRAQGDTLHVVARIVIN
jgi:phosphohistidine phosphatase SixA